MPVCKTCQSLLAPGEVCSKCGGKSIEFTQIESPPDSTTELDTARPFRPRGRPPVARLTILDDDDDDNGEVVRIRHQSTSIGRSDCDINIPQDCDISATHATIVRESSSAGFRWFLVDQESTNGTFVRVKDWTFAQNKPFYLGGELLFWNNTPGPPDSRAVQLSGGETYQIIDRADHVLRIGTASECDIRLGDPTVSNFHAELRFDGSNWSIHDVGSRNGIWVHLPKFVLASGSRFLLGQQRFEFRLPGSEEQG